MAVTKKSSAVPSTTDTCSQRTRGCISYTCWHEALRHLQQYQLNKVIPTACTPLEGKNSSHIPPHLKKANTSIFHPDGFTAGGESPTLQRQHSGQDTAGLQQLPWDGTHHQPWVSSSSAHGSSLSWSEPGQAAETTGRWRRALQQLWEFLALFFPRTNGKAKGKQTHLTPYHPHVACHRKCSAGLWAALHSSVTWSFLESSHTRLNLKFNYFFFNLQ